MSDHQRSPSTVPWDLLVLAAIIAAKSVLVCKLAGFGWPSDPGRMMTYGTAFLLVAPLAGLSGTARARARLGLNLGLTALFVGDVTYALYFQDILSLHSAGGIGGLGTVMSSISALVGLGSSCWCPICCCWGSGACSGADRPFSSRGVGMQRSA